MNSQNDDEDVMDVDEQPVNVINVIDEMVKENDHSYNDYYYLFWKIILDKKNLPERNEFKMEDDELIEDENKRNQFIQRLYDIIIQTLLDFPKHLNLSVYDEVNDNENNKENEENKENTIENKTELASDNEITTNNNTKSTNVQTLKPYCIRDFDIFINYVEFTKLILLATTTRSLFEKWLYSFGKEIINFSEKYPLVSGFYKLFECCLNIAEDLHYFNGILKIEYIGEPHKVSNIKINYIYISFIVNNIFLEKIIILILLLRVWLMKSTNRIQELNKEHTYCIPNTLMK